MSYDPLDRAQGAADLARAVVIRIDRAKKLGTGQPVADLQQLLGDACVAVSMLSDAVLELAKRQS